MQNFAFLREVSRRCFTLFAELILGGADYSTINLMYKQKDKKKDRPFSTDVLQSIRNHHKETKNESARKRFTLLAYAGVFGQLKGQSN